MPREILVEGQKTFRITVPDDARMTFGPFSPPSKGDDRYARGYEEKKGTLRVYRGTKGSTTENILAVFSGVTSFHDVGEIEYKERVAIKEGNAIWKSDEKGYMEERKEQGSTKWVSVDSGDNQLETEEPF